MRIASFDIFDTLLTRLVAEPRDLFLIAAERLRAAGLLKISKEEFARLRVNAENESRQAYEHRETTFSEIYAKLAAALNWDADQTSAACKIELETERQWLRATPGGRARLESARKEAERVLFLSDMYLPGEFLRDLLIENKLWRDGDELVASNEAKCSKASGQLFARIRQEAGEVKSWRHLGDNEHADIRMAVQNGIEAEHFPHCALTRYERTFRPATEFATALWRTKIAGAIRYARLGAPQEAHSEGIWNVGASVAGAFLFGFVLWILEEASKRQIKRLYFISRDGEILFRIAEKILARWKFDVEARYLHGSRQAWRPAADQMLDQWFKAWVSAAPTPTNLKSFFSRLGLDPNRFEKTLAAAGFPKNSWEDILDFSARDELWAAIEKSEIAEAAIARRKEQRQLARRYLLQEGLGDDLSMAVVDVGWLGSMQRCVDAILSDVPARQQKPFHGFYIGLHTRGDRMFTYWEDRPGRALQQANIGFFERFTVALHGSVQGYVEKDGRLAPDFEQGANSRLLEWGAETLQAGILKTTETFLDVLSPGELPHREFFALAQENFVLFTEHPSREEAVVFGQMPTQDQANEITAPTLIPKLSEWQMLRAALDYRRRLPGWWMEGAARLTGSPWLRIYLWARRWRRRS